MGRNERISSKTYFKKFNLLSVRFSSLNTLTHKFRGSVFFLFFQTFLKTHIKLKECLSQWSLYSNSLEVQILRYMFDIIKSGRLLGPQWRFINNKYLVISLTMYSTSLYQEFIDDGKIDFIQDIFECIVLGPYLNGLDVKCQALKRLFLASITF